MDWNNIWESTISGIFVVIFGGIAGWIVYCIGIKGKERSQIASQRKQEIYIPLKYELKNLIDMRFDIWTKITVPEIEKILDKNDELVVSEDIYLECSRLYDLINTYNQIDLYFISSDILNRRFEEKYLELYGSTTHTEYAHYEDEDVEIEATDYELLNFDAVTSDKRNIDNLMKNDIGYDEYCQDEGYVSPTEEFIARMCASVLPKGDKKYSGINFDRIKNDSLKSKKITPAEYIAYGFDFLKKFKAHSEVQRKEELLYIIKENSLNVLENVIVKIRAIGNKYEKE